MSDRVKVFLALILFVAALILPLVGLGVGLYHWDVEIGIYIMVGTFLVLFILGGAILFRVRNLNWLTVSLPYLFGIGYTLSPDLLPFGGDDAAVTVLGSVMAYFLALRKDPRTPKWIIIPLLIGAIYVFFGGPIPGGLDELVVNFLAIAVAGYGVNRATKEEEEPSEWKA